jgi:hypothetical protein
VLAYRAIGRARARIGDREDTARAFDRAVSAAHWFSGDNLDAHLAEIAVDRAAAGDLEGASRTLRLLTLPHDEARVVLARGYAKAGQDELAVATAVKSKEDLGRIRAFIGIGEAYMARGDRDRASGVRSSRKAAEKRPDESVTTYWPRDIGLREVMSDAAHDGWPRLLCGAPTIHDRAARFTASVTHSRVPWTRSLLSMMSPPGSLLEARSAGTRYKTRHTGR